MNIKFVVMVSDCQKRKENAEKIASQIPDCVLYYGDNDNVFNKFINCFRLENKYDGLVLLEDDIILCKDFYEKIMSEIIQKPQVVISFFEQPMARKKLVSGFMPPSKFLFNQCNYYPANVCQLIQDEKMIDRFKNFYSKKWVCPSDEYINYVLVNYKINYFMKVPFFVQHQPWESTLGHRSTARQTKYFIDDIGE